MGNNSNKISGYAQNLRNIQKNKGNKYVKCLCCAQTPETLSAPP